jgi:nucleoside-diphosphate-sugar epimerase
VARVLIVGCGCRGQALARELVAAGHAVRGTTREPARLAAIEEAGAEALLADPDRLGTLMPHIEGVSILCWLLGTVRVADLHGPRLRTLLERLVDTPVRGFLYEAPLEEAFTGGVAAVQEASVTWSIPAEVVEADDTAWLAAASAAVARLL